ncbi:hypothetical protein PRIPAC_80562 [Pristionchus pacificus]|uniref:C6 domain-containing protein n=1 Tax=Pristionchus pacificus TaxID=54126 RepID=A0A2A6CMG3_PRIPA|nr:hypothetical protein PRIPAC_80562 [Pristionchus pacificus]|eukprot:PDM79277.1 hypothetical protein PRIPAC_31856 [Pristionchus pacificus]
MLIRLVMFLSSSVIFIDSCVPTPSTPTPAPIICGALCPAGLLVAPPPFTENPPTTTPTGCAVRTLVCMATPPLYTRAVITYNGVSMVFDDGTGTAVLPVTCNSAGTAWTYMGTPITSVSCALFP